MPGQILCRVSEGLAHVTLSHAGKLNAMSRHMWLLGSNTDAYQIPVAVLFRQAIGNGLKPDRLAGEREVTNNREDFPVDGRGELVGPKPVLHLPEAVRGIE